MFVSEDKKDVTSTVSTYPRSVEASSSQWQGSSQLILPVSFKSTCFLASKFTMVLFLQNQNPLSNKGSPPPYFIDQRNDQIPRDHTRSTGQLPINFVDIDKHKGKIVGRWKLDTNMEIPRIVMRKMKKKKEKERPNLFLKCDHGSIDAVVDLVGGYTRAILKAKARHGSITFKLVSSRLGCFPIYVQHPDIKTSPIPKIKK